MTENEYLELPWSVEDTIENLEEIKEIMIAKVRAVNLDGKAESGAKEIEFDFGRAISALKEIQQYRALGTVEELAGIQNSYFTLSQKIRQYEKIGTVEELRKAMEKQSAKIPDIWGDGYDDEGNMIYDMYDCPNCGESYEIDYGEYEFCPKCGQAIDQSVIQEGDMPEIKPDDRQN